MQEDFHYYATYCAAHLAGYSHDECMDICYSANFTDLCSGTLLAGIGAPVSAATTQLSLEMMDMRHDHAGLAGITRIWSSFHFLPRDLYAEVRKGTKRYKNKYRLICGPNGQLAADTVNLAKGKSLQAVGIAMHVLADTWAHSGFAGTPSFVINNTDHYFYEIMPDGTERHITFSHGPGADDIETGKFNSSIYQSDENSIMNLGHGRAGHLPDYSFIKYRYLPAWGDYKEIVKDNPSDYYKAFCQMVYALKTLRSDSEVFKTGVYDMETAAQWKNDIVEILNRRQLIACGDWKSLGEKMSGCIIDSFDGTKYLSQYSKAEAKEKESTFLGKFINAALSQKMMVSECILRSGNSLAGVRGKII